MSHLNLEGLYGCSGSLGVIIGGLLRLLLMVHCGSSSGCSVCHLEGEIMIISEVQERITQIGKDKSISSDYMETRSLWQPHSIE